MRSRTLPVVFALGWASLAPAQAVLFEDLGADFVPANGSQAGNALGDIVGYRVSTDQAAIRKDDGTIIDLGSLGGPQSRGNAISTDGSVAVGWSDNGNGFQNSFRFADGTLTSIFGVQPGDNQAVGIDAGTGDVVANAQSIQGGGVFRWVLSDSSFSQAAGNAQARNGVSIHGSFAGQLDTGRGFHQTYDGSRTFISPGNFNPLAGVNDQDLVAGNIDGSFAAFYFLGAPSAQAVPNVSSLGSTSTATGVTDSNLIFGNTSETVFLFDFFEDLLLDLNTVQLIGASSVDRLVSIHGVAKGADIFFGEYLTTNAETRYFKGTISFDQDLSGDYDENGVVNRADYDLWAQTYGELGGYPLPDQTIYYSQADGNGDEVVDAADYTIWRDSLTAYNFNAVPEPSGLIAILLGLALTARPWACRSAGSV